MRWWDVTRCHCDYVYTVTSFINSLTINYSFIQSHFWASYSQVTPMRINGSEIWMDKWVVIVWGIKAIPSPLTLCCFFEVPWNNCRKSYLPEPKGYLQVNIIHDEVDELKYWYKQQNFKKNSKNKSEPQSSQSSQGGASGSTAILEVFRPLCSRMLLC